MIRATLRPFFRPETAFFLVVGTLLLVLFRERAFYDPGSLWHVKVGDIILEKGFPWTDPFTYTFEGKTWIPQQWGGEVLMALAHRAGGLDTMLLGFVVLITGLFTWVFARTRAAGTHWALAAALTGAALFVGSFHYFVRPHMFTIVLLGWTMGCVVDFDRGRAGLARLAALIPLYVLWTNLHGGVLGGAMTLGLAVAGWGLLFLLKQDSPIRNWRTAWVLAAVVVSCLLTPFDNPFGMEMINTWKRIVGSDVLKQVVNEHKPLDLTKGPDQLVAGFGVLYLFLLAGTLPKRPRVTWLIPLVWLALTVKGIRQGPLFVICGAVAIADLWPHTLWHRLLKKYGDSLAHVGELKPVRWPAFAVPTAAVVAIFLLQFNQVPGPIVGRGWARLDPMYVPVELTDALKTYARSEGARPRIYNDANLGGYLIYHVPELKIFMDDRFELYGDDWTQKYVDVYWYNPKGVEEWADRYDLDLAVVVTGPERSKLDQYLAGTSHNPANSAIIGAAAWPTAGNGTWWTEVARAKCAVIYRRHRP